MSLSETEKLLVHITKNSRETQPEFGSSNDCHQGWVSPLSFGFSLRQALFSIVHDFTPSPHSAICKSGEKESQELKQEPFS